MSDPRSTFPYRSITASFRISDISDAQPPVEQDEETPEGEEEDDLPEGSAPQVTITVTKPTSAQGSLVFTTFIEEGTFSIENVSLFDEIVDVTKETAETEYKKDAAYGGPSQYRSLQLSWGMPFG